ncbi:VOC family protein [Pyxidicoccus fallax]|uniref:VOC family protein n=1 Tax=Pyxidicoccus fallax TaxID=394095 RepID=A0A848LBV5_9BACT|nr:VOC family protein [Pyxidicoccus fallax]NMO15966.1 VOC family protein [Pyxidicoccus fallax]NPC79954.1 VOC family protein [Pyxidicoccus fallax]
MARAAARSRARLHGGLLLAAGLCALGGLFSAMAGCASTPSGASKAGIPISPVPLYGKFVWHDLVTEDPAAVKRFYGELLGWEFQDVKGSKRPYSLIKARGRWMGGIVQPIGVGKGHSQWLGYLSVPDVDRAVEQAGAGGGKALVGPEDVEKIGRAAVITDPQGAPVGFVRSQPGDPADTGLPEPGQFLWTEHLAEDPVAAATFYKDLLGYEVEARDESGGTYYLLKQGQQPRAGILRKPLEVVRPNWLTYVRVEDPAALAARVESLGGRVVMAPRPDVRGGSLALIADPTGAVLALQRYPFKTEEAAEASP